MKILKYLITLLVLWPAYFLIKLIPKQRKLWCFSSYRDSFVDNSKYLFHYVHLKHSDIDAVWVTDDLSLYQELREAGYKVVKRKSFRGIITVVRAEYVFCSSYVSEVSFWLSSGAKLVNLWHGLPLKKIEFDITSGVLADKYAASLTFKQLFLRLFFPSAYRKPDFITAPSEEMAEIFKSAFRVIDKNILKASSPRTDQFFDSSTFASLPQVGTMPKSKHKIFIYMPTFRDTGGPFFSDRNFNFIKLDQLMSEIEGEFWIKAHPSAGVESLDLTGLERIKLLPSNTDMYPVLKNSYALITDYSSIYIDYLMLDKPIYFYCFDLKDYLQTCRSMYFEYDDVTPGSKCEDFEQLLNCLLRSDDEFRTERERVTKLFWGQDYQSSCKKIVETLSKLSP